MARIISNNQKYKLFDFDFEDDFEKVVIENKIALFGPESVYLDVKRKIGKGSRQGIPDAFLIDFENRKTPQLYIVENELSSHYVYAHITEKVARFSATLVSDTPQIRQKILDVIHSSSGIKSEIELWPLKTSQ